MSMQRNLLGVAAVGVATLATAAPAGALEYGSTPLNISRTVGAVANGNSANPTLSGDNRTVRLAAYDSEASNLVGGDGNGAADVFVWTRPGSPNAGSVAQPGGQLTLASTGAGGIGNGASTNPSLDGSLRDAPHCVAFQSTATNLASGDSDATSDIFLRDLRSNRTTLVSTGISPAATNATIDGGCDQVAFEAGGSVFLARVGSTPKKIGSGGAPDLSRDGTAVVWEDGASIRIRREVRGLAANGSNSTVGRGDNPTVSDAERIRRNTVWGISYESGANVYTREVKQRGNGGNTDLVSAARRNGRSLGGNSQNGGITSFGTNRGIVMFATSNPTGTFPGYGGDGRTTLFYRNNNTGNIDDLVSVPNENGLSSIDLSARANFVIYRAKALTRPLAGQQQLWIGAGNGATTDIYIKFLPGSGAGPRPS